jgi:hypothetical protein
MQAEQLTGIYRNILSNQHESYSFGQTNMLFFGNVDFFLCTFENMDAYQSSLFHCYLFFFKDQKVGELLCSPSFFIIKKIY